MIVHTSRRLAYFDIATYDVRTIYAILANYQTDFGTYFTSLRTAGMLDLIHRQRTQNLYTLNLNEA